MKATHSGGSHPCVVNEFADAVAAWRAGTVGFKVTFIYMYHNLTVYKLVRIPV